MVARLESVGNEAVVNSQLVQPRVPTDDDAEDSDRVHPRRAIPKPTSSSRRKAKTAKENRPAGGDNSQGSRASRSLRLKVIPPSTRTPLVTSAATAPVVLGLPDQSAQPVGKKNKSSTQRRKNPAPAPRKKRCVRPAASVGHASGVPAEVAPPVPAPSTVPSASEPLLDVLPDLSCLDLPTDLGMRMGAPITLQEIANFSFDDDVVVLEDEAEVAAVIEVSEPVSAQPVPRVPITDCGITLLPRQVPVAASEASEKVLAPFRDFVWKMWENFREERLLPMPSLEDSSIAQDVQFLFAKMKEVGFDTSLVERLVADYISTTRDLTAARDSASGKLVAEEQQAEEAKANDAIQGSLRKKEGIASRLEDALSRLDRSRQERDRLREQLEELEANILSSETEVHAAKEDLEAALQEAILVEDELTRVRALPVISQTERDHLASLEHTFSSLQKELKDLKSL